MRRKWKLILGGVIAIIVTAMIVSGITADKTVEKTTTEQTATTPLVVLETIGVNSHGGLVAYVHTPGAGSLTWHNKQGEVISGTDTWDQSTTGDVSVSPVPGANLEGSYPVLTTPQSKIEGKALK